MVMPTMPLDPEEVLQALWLKVCCLETQVQEQAITIYRLRTEMTSALGIVGVMLMLRAQVEELDEKVKRLDTSQPFT